MEAWIRKRATQRLTNRHFRGNKMAMKEYTAVVERCPETGFFVGYVPGFKGAHSQGETREELEHNLQEVIAMLSENGTRI